jgi:catechol 2,3-dioxygenase-like lactoylglutathione lyase family enzyme
VTPQRINLITLGVTSLSRSRAFYARWGWTPCEESTGVVFYDLGGFRLGLFGLDDLAADQGRDGQALGAGAMTLAQNFPDRPAVDAAFARALGAGAGALKRPVATPWGGYSGYVTDPDGHVWELAHNPFWPLDNEGWLEPAQ